MKFRAHIILPLLCASACVALPSCSPAQEPAAEASEATPAEIQKAPEPEQLLRRVAEYLEKLEAFAYRAEINVEIARGDASQSLVTKMVVRIQKPNRIASIIEEGTMGMTIVSDGKQLVRYLPTMKRYTVQDAPDDMEELRSVTGISPIGIMGIIGVVIPADTENIPQVSSAKYLGMETIGDIACHHCRFEQESFSWEMWIEAGDRPLVHKVVSDLSKQIGRSAPAEDKPQVHLQVVFSDWDVAPQFTEADFQFEPPPEAEEVDSLFERDEGPHPLLGQAAPSFETVGPDGQPIDLSQHLGKSVIMLDFWATWCGPCIAAMPQIEEVANKFADQGLVFYAVNSGEDAATINEFLESNELDVPVAMDPEGAVGSLYKVEGIPQTVLIGKDGKVQVVHVGFSKQLGKQLTSEVEALLEGQDLAGPILEKAEKKRQRRKSAKDDSQESDSP